MMTGSDKVELKDMNNIDKFLEFIENDKSTDCSTKRYCKDAIKDFRNNCLADVFYDQLIEICEKAKAKKVQPLSAEFAIDNLLHEYGTPISCGQRIDINLSLIMPEKE